MFCKLHPIEVLTRAVPQATTFCLWVKNFFHIRLSQVFLVRDLWTPCKFLGQALFIIILDTFKLMHILETQVND